MNKCILVIPCYNEAERLDRAAFSAFMEQHPEVFFLFVNDGSSDATGAVLAKLCARRANAAFFELERNCGKAEAVRRGMLRALELDADCGFIGFYDADLSTSLDEIPRFLELAGDGMLMISGCRLRRLGGNVKRTFIRHLQGRIFATVISRYLKLPVYDTQCGAKLYARSEVAAIAAQPFVTRWLFDVEILKRLTDRHGNDEIIRRCCEMPLRKWSEIGGSKLRYCAILKDFLKLLGRKK